MKPLPRMGWMAALVCMLCGVVCGPAAGDPVIDDSLEVWFKADTGCLNSGGGACTNNQKVATWQDQATTVGQSGANNATQSTDARRPVFFTNAVNGQPVVRFYDASGDWRYLQTGSIGDFSNHSVFTAFLVGKRNSDHVGVFFYNSYGDDLAAWGLQSETSPSLFSFVGRTSAGNVRKAASGEADTGYHLLEGQWTANDVVKILVDGMLMPTNSGANASPTTHSLLRLGDLSALIPQRLYPLNGDIAEMLIYSRELTDAERKQVGNYLAAKYGLEVYYTQPVPGGVLFRHDGTNNPTGVEGWNALLGAVRPTYGPTNDAGTLAWVVNDPSSADGSYLWYTNAFTAKQRNTALANGWRLRTKLRVVNTNDTSDWGIAVVVDSYQLGVAKRFAMQFGSTADGRVIVSLPLELLVTNPRYTNSTSGGYHEYELRWAFQASAARLYVDGNDTGITYGGFPWTDKIVEWGAGSSANTGNGHYHLVEFEVLRSASLAGAMFLLR